jgi:guanosine-3',5'-bis(diphosphate) 3'-pyrophosphohydrolase
MERLEAELDDLAFAVLEPNEYRWLSEAVAEEKHQRSSYVSRVCEILREEMAKIGLRAEVSGRVKHLYSTYRKVQSRGIRDISQLYDIVAFRITVDTVADCYLALGHVHHLWRPKDGRIKDFIANPKPNGYQALHTTVFCLDERLAEIQICTHAMHQVAKYGVAMHWHYKREGDTASAAAPELQAWVKQVMEWQQELQQGPATGSGAAETVDGAVPAELIYVFTPAGDPKELPAGSTPLDFAYRIHSSIGDHCAGARVTTEDGRLVTKMVPLDYELRNGDTVEIITHKGAHPTRDWLHFAHTKAARNHIQRYLKAHERHIDQQIGRDRLDRELKTQGVRTGIEMLHDDDLLWVARELDLKDVESLLVALGIEKLKATAVIGKVRERLPDLFPPPPEAHEAPAPTVEPEVQGGVDVAGVAGLYTRLASCCNPAPGDPVRGFITRGRGVVVHRADCPSLAAMLEREPERAVPVELSTLEGHQTYHVPIVVQATDRPGLLADVTGVISRLKINMVKVTTVTNEARHSATITAILEVERADQLETVIRQVAGIKSILSVGRKEHPQPKALAGSGSGPSKKK